MSMNKGWNPRPPVGDATMTRSSVAVVAEDAREISDASDFFAQAEGPEGEEGTSDQPTPNAGPPRPDLSCRGILPKDPEPEPEPDFPRANGPGKWIFAGVVLALILQALGAGVWWGWGEYQEYLASRPPDLFDVDSPQEAVAGESIGSSRMLEYGDLDDWSKAADKVETRTVYAARATGVHTQDLVQWTQREGEAPKDEVLAQDWTWLFTDGERSAWPLQDDLEICGIEGDLLAWSKADKPDGLVRITRTGADGNSESKIESVKGGAYWCSYVSEDGRSYSLEMRWHPGIVIIAPVDYGEPVTTRKVEKREVVSGIKLAIDHKD